MSLGTQVTSTSVVSIVYRCTVVAAALCISLFAEAYDVRYTAVTADIPVSARFAGYCPSQSGAHTMMPMKESFQTSAFSTLSKAGFTEAAIGGWNPFASCSGERCGWIFTAGLMNGTPADKSTFLYGTVYKGVDHTEAVPGMYQNFIKGVMPTAFFRRQENVIPKMMVNGSWMNELRDKLYSSWICESYEFTASEEATAPATDENGYIIRNISRSRFPWWAGLLIAIGVVLIVVAILIVYCCCRKKQQEEQEKKKVEEILHEENLSRIPTQSELGLGRSASQRCNGSFRASGAAGFGWNDSFGDGGFQRQMSMRGCGGFQPQMNDGPNGLQRQMSMRGRGGFQPQMNDGPNVVQRQMSMRGRGGFQPQMNDGPNGLQRQMSMRGRGGFQPQMNDGPNVVQRQMSMRGRGGFQPQMNDGPNGLQRQMSMRGRGGFQPQMNDGPNVVQRQMSMRGRGGFQPQMNDGPNVVQRQMSMRGRGGFQPQMNDGPNVVQRQMSMRGRGGFQPQMNDGPNVVQRQMSMRGRGGFQPQMNDGPNGLQRQMSMRGRGGFQPQMNDGPN
ncbi:hypothetical protein LSM04_002827 [Trypanosoma melophagium]|uniref:uncharacterized protein n=1 Tax=Trypanosoma melophagium TaxID=715481 RepID=UPI003519E652|nr:hypothetical protein LSM04_002827 [Trypanosoma melophagium]